MLRLITFDVTGTLLRPQVTASEQYAAAVRSVVDCSQYLNRIQESFYKSYKDHSNAYPIYGTKSGKTSKSWWMSVFLDSLIRSGAISQSSYGIHSLQNNLSIPLYMVDESSPLKNAFENVYNDFKWAPFPFATELLQFIKGRNEFLGVGIITNNDNRVGDALKKTGLNSYIDFIITSTACGYEKPHKHIFKEALRLASKLTSIDKPLKPSQALHVGDSLEKDYRGATDFGFNALLLDPDNKHFDQQHCIKDLSMVQNKIKVFLTSTD